MELRSISEIRREGFDYIDYASNLGLTPRFSVSRALNVVNEIMTLPANVVPASDGVFYRFLCMAESIFLIPENEDGELDREIGDFSTLNGFDSDNTVRIGYNYDGRERVIFLTHAQHELFINVLNAYEGYEDEYAANTIAQAEASLTPEDLETCILLGLGNPEIIPENSESLTVKENTSRFSGAMWFEAIQQKIVILAGVGGIGSYVGFLLARMHPRSMFIYDDDMVEAANMSGQLYGKTDIGRYKVDALANMVGNYADFGSIFAVNQRYTEQCEPADIMICGFDNMEARRLFFLKWKSHVESKPVEERVHCLFIDGRLAAEELQIFCITGDNSWGITEYETKYLFSDAEADTTLCSYKQTSYMANMIGSLIVNLFTNFVANELLGFLGRDLPFLTQYSGLSMQFKVE